jgi:hypothetical protein
MSTTERVDGKYYQAVPSHSLRELLLIRARDRIYDDFLRICRPRREDTILDVGISDVVNDGANVIERKYPYPERITAVGLGAAAEFRQAFPRVAYERIEPNRRLPFADKSFDIAVSNAVLEHVGSVAHQALLVRELQRVAHTVFISVPNRFFPVEHHTAIPLLHFFDAPFRLACRWLKKGEWTEEKNLIVMTRRKLAALAPEGAVASVNYTGVRVGPFSSNIYLLLDCDRADG